MNNKILLENVIRRLTAVSILLKPTTENNLSNVAKSSYYRAAIIFTCSVVEGLVYELVKQYSQKDLFIISSKDEYKGDQQISDKLTGRTDLYLCQKVKKDVMFNDSGVNFVHHNKYLKDQKIINQSEFNLLEKIRDERNKIHIQVLNLKDTGYTKKKVNVCTKPILFLIKKLD